KHLFLTLSLALFIILAGCKKVFPDGPAVTETRSVSDFDKIEATFSSDVEFTQGPSKSVTVKAAENLQHYIITEVTGNTLVLKTRPNVDIRGGHVTIYVTNPTLNAATLSGSGNFVSGSDLNTASLNLKLSGSGNIFLSRLTGNTLDARITGSGDISINGGSVQTQEITVTGNGDYHTQSMRSGQARVKLTGSGEARLWAEDQLDVQISGSGDVWYLGAPAVNASISGSGKVRKI